MMAWEPSSTVVGTDPSTAASIRPPISFKICTVALRLISMNCRPAPVSSLWYRNSSSFLLMKSSAARNRMSLRKPGFVWDHEAKAALAASTAPRASLTEAADPSHSFFASKGLVTGNVDVDVTSSPLIMNGTVSVVLVTLSKPTCACSLGLMVNSIDLT
jgi:hypothetical protein